jgi:hypothetical protein
MILHGPAMLDKLVVSHLPQFRSAAFAQVIFWQETDRHGLILA